ncbi:Ger(x)C family spore germination protein [Paenibacillus wynnii]|uniref:Spore gernimation protein GerC n=1 Tax=Paenibacillus wynnii TaxID=268407 RepID=A0A098M9D0_9BACL|nr:Ger(x)C family spore germination protein [Paenibacillus wynnii]KGE18658.1 spore gernimation protein GerC [Paenibacillus wynnii]
MRKLGVMFLLLLISLWLSGCSNRVELNELGIITATGVDGKSGAWIVTYQIIIPSAMASGTGGGGGGSQSAVHTFSTEAKTIREAIDISNLENPRRLYFAHNNVLLIGKKSADQGINEIIDIYLRNFETRETVKVLVADGEARELLKQLTPPEKVPGVALAKILAKDNQLGSFFPLITVYEIAQRISSDSEAAGIPEVAKVGSGDGKLDTIEVFQKTSAKVKLKLSGLSVIKGSKRIATLKQKESQGVSWLNNQMNSSTLSFTDPVKNNEEKRYTAFQVRKATVKATPIKGPLHYTLKVDVKVKGEIVESETKINITKSKGINQMQQLINKEIEAQILNSWQTIQSLKVDLAGVANKIHRKYPKDWHKIKDTWPEELARMDIKINVETVISRPGLFQNSFKKQIGK